MTYRGVGLIFMILLFQGCASLEPPRWAMLGDTAEKAYFIDRHAVERLPNGNYLYPVRINLYKADSPHTLADSHDTNRVLFVELSCNKMRWKEAGRGVMDKDNRLLFKHLTPLPASNVIETGTIHFSAYSYLCMNDEIVIFHNH